MSIKHPFLLFLPLYFASVSLGFSQVLVDASFDTGFIGGNTSDITNAEVGLGWYQDQRWIDGTTQVARNTGVDQGGGVFTVPYDYPTDKANRRVGSLNQESWFGQVVQDSAGTTGSQSLQFDYAMWNQDASPGNTILYEVYGSNDITAPTFTLGSDTMGAGWTPIFTGSYVTDVAQFTEDADTLIQALDFGAGFEFIGVRFRSNGVQVQASTNTTAGEYLSIDNVSIIPEPGTALLMLGGLGILLGRRRRI